MLEKVAYAADILAAIGVIVSLVYVGRQLKQTNTTSRSMLRQSMSGLLTNLTISIAASPELAGAVSKVLSEGRTRDELTSVERTKIAVRIADRPISQTGSIIDFNHRWAARRRSKVTRRPLPTERGLSSLRNTCHRNVH